MHGRGAGRVNVGLHHGHGSDLDDLRRFTKRFCDFTANQKNRAPDEDRETPVGTQEALNALTLFPAAGPFCTGRGGATREMEG